MHDYGLHVVKQHEALWAFMLSSVFMRDGTFFSAYYKEGLRDPESFIYQFYT